MNNFSRQTEFAPGVNLHLCVEKWKDYSLDKLAQEEKKIQEAYFIMQENPALESQARTILETLQKYIESRYRSEEKKNQKKLNL